jgi:transposase
MDSKTVLRRRHSRQLKAEVLAACERPGASVAGVALAHGLNANLVHKWRRGEGQGASPRLVTVAGEFIALPMPTPSASIAQADIRVELHRGATTATVSWPISGAAECAAWLRDWLR